ncbi:EpsG family protein [Shewanella baltica]|uniref:EpsG family protein n=1 Tax=Shewanella baltica TaxID=62322 RepID=UPI002169D4DE|nr:EpsG family protein [Shewanella baltica]MCS6113302.1 EpsG family protein [Shewanella baltica]UVW64707.1 EpsG family protein [Shewanella baltica]
MSLYLVLLLYFPLFLLPISKGGALLGFKLVLVILYSVFLFLHIDAGPDHVIYKWAYEQPFGVVLFEPFYLLLTMISKFLGFSYYDFLIFLRSINCLLFSIFVFKVDKLKLLFFLSLYIPISFLTFELNLLRQSLAIHICFLSILAYMNGKLKLSLVFFVLAICSHFSSLILVFLYLNRVNKLILIFCFSMLLSIVFPFLIDKVIAYQSIGGLEFRSGIFMIQLGLLLLIPFFIFSFPGGAYSIFLYATICLLSFIPVLVRLYPLALLLIAPFALYKYNNRFVIYFLLIISFFMCVVKTNLLISADNFAIKEGIYEKGYQ